MEMKSQVSERTKRKKASMPVVAKGRDHTASTTRINRIKGQVDAISRMMGERRYCPEIIQQIRAATNALKSLEREVLKGHLQGCVRSAMESKDPFLVRDKVDEIVKLWD